MIDPFTLSAVGLIALRYISRRGAKEAQKEAAAAQKEVKGATQTLQRNSEKLFTSMKCLNVYRGGHLRRLVKRIDRAATKLGLRNQAYESKIGWFGGKQLAEVTKLVSKAYDLCRPPRSIIDSKVAMASWGVLLVQGIEELDRFEIIEIPILDEKIVDLAGDLSPELGAGLGDVLGDYADFSVADALGVAMVFYSVFRIGRNLSKENEARSAAARFRTELEELRSKTTEVEAIASRSGYIERGLEEASYEAFKWAWVADQIAASPSPRRRVAAIVGRRLEVATRRLWDFLNVPLVDENGRAHNGPLPA